MTEKKRKPDPELIALLEEIHLKMEGVTEEEVYAVLEKVDSRRKQQMTDPRQAASSERPSGDPPRRGSA